MVCPQGPPQGDREDRVDQVLSVLQGSRRYLAGEAGAKGEKVQLNTGLQHVTQRMIVSTRLAPSAGRPRSRIAGSSWPTLSPWTAPESQCPCERLLCADGGS